MNQAYTSAATSINSTKLPAVYGKLPFKPVALLDYGCGKYTDHIRAALPGTAYIPYDKYNQSAAVNRRAETYVRSFQAAGIAVDVVCSNVLNVIAEDSIIESIAADIRRIIAGGGSAYITVYEGNRSGAGRQTGPDQWQRNERLSAYLRFFPGAEIHNGMIIVKG